MKQSVRCKFVCESVTNFEKGKQVQLRAVTGKEGENADFTKYTPNGNVQISLDNEAPAAESFTPGKNYYVDFTEVEDI